MTLEERLRSAMEERDKAANEANMHEQARQECFQIALRADERVKLLSDLIKEQNAPKEPEKPVEDKK